MTVKYHGTPLTPKAELLTLAGFSFCIPFIRPDSFRVCVTEGLASSVMFDSGAFRAWRRGAHISWPGYYRWLEKGLTDPNNWAIIGDVIDGTEEDNDQLIKEWPHGDRGAPVWHLHESLDKLKRLTTEWPRVCFGSSGEYASVGAARWTARMVEAFDAISLPDGTPPTKLHMLRGLKLVKGYPYPFDSVDSTNVCRNFRRNQKTALQMATEWEQFDCPDRWLSP